MWRSERAAVGGSVLAVALALVLSALMVPLRDHVNVAIAALVLVIPVVVGVAVGGFTAGIVATAVGFLFYDFVFIPPYYTLGVGAAQNWAALAVYAVVMVVVSRVVARVKAARAEAQRRASEIRRLFDLSELLLQDSSLPELFAVVVGGLQEAFELAGAALLLPAGASLELVASAGEPLSERELAELSARVPHAVSLGTGLVRTGAIQAVALVVRDRPVGLLALRGLAGSSTDQTLLHAFANHVALALERAQLREQVVRTRLLEEVDRLRRSLVGAVSHDLRSPLATIKVATSTLLDPEARVAPSDARELVALLDQQADHLDRLVANVLDMTRIQAGALELRRTATSLDDLVHDALRVLGLAAEPGQVRWSPPPDLGPVDVDPVLVCQVLANLLDNAIRHSPEGTPVTITATPAAHGLVHVAVEDRGPGIPVAERQSIFQMFNSREAGGRGGLGLAIAQAFVEVHGQRIWVDDPSATPSTPSTPSSPSNPSTPTVPVGARLVFTLPLATSQSAAQPRRDLGPRALSARPAGAH